MDAHKSEVLSVNLSSSNFLQSESDCEEAWELRDRLKEMNSCWDRLGASLEHWREELQRALMQCQVLKTHFATRCKNVERGFLTLAAHFQAGQINNSEKTSLAADLAPWLSRQPYNMPQG